jgi:hypothetical protein
MNGNIGAAHATANEGESNDFDPDGSLPRLSFGRQLVLACDCSEINN